MIVRKHLSGKWFSECYLFRASGKRIRMQFATKGEALSHERCIINNVFDLQFNTRLVLGLYFMNFNLNSGVR